jgi:UDP-N-acetylmuramoylalanine--D-glutamate ligase
VVLASSIEEAVERSFALAAPGDAVLLSPACSSFDMFRSYAERGDRFVAAVNALGAGGGRGAS